MSASPSHDALISQSFDDLTNFTGIAKKMTDLVISGEHSLDALPTLSSYLAGIAAKNTALKAFVSMQHKLSPEQRRTYE